MATFILIHGAWHGGWSFDLVQPILEAQGHKVIAPDLPGMGGTDEELAALDEKASRKLCTSTKSNKDLGASNLASCKSQGLRSREGNKSHLLGKGPESRVVMGGHKLKGKKYGGKIPDWGTRKGQL